MSKVAFKRAANALQFALVDQGIVKASRCFQDTDDFGYPVVKVVLDCGEHINILVANHYDPMPHFFVNWSAHNGGQDFACFEGTTHIPKAFFNIGTAAHIAKSYAEKQAAAVAA